MLRDIHTEQKDCDARIIVMAASTRTGSMNRALARRIADELEGGGESVHVVDLADHLMPLYDGDVEDRDGVPPAAAQLAKRLSSAEVLVIVTPEYNGAFTPLLKNSVDWMTRHDTRVLAHLRILLASASPGRGGGARAVDMLRTWMGNISVEVAEHSLSVGAAEVADDGTISGVDPRALAEFTDQAVRSDAEASS